MTANSPDKKNWHYKTGEQIKTSQSAADLQKKLEEGITVSISNGDTYRCFLVQAYFPGDTPFDGDATAWQAVAEKAHTVFENFVEQMITTGLLDPLLNPNSLSDLDIEVSQLEMSFEQIGKGLQYGHHQYFNREEKTSIEKQKEEKYTKAAERLHQKDDELNKTQLMETVQNIHGALLDKDPFNFQVVQRIEYLCKALEKEPVPKRKDLEKLLTKNKFKLEANALVQILNLTEKYLEGSKKEGVYESLSEILLMSLDDPSYSEENKTLLEKPALKKQLESKIEKHALAIFSFAETNSLFELKSKVLKALESLPLKNQLDQMHCYKESLPQEVISLFVRRAKEEKDPKRALDIFNSLHKLSQREFSEAKGHLALVVFANGPNTNEVCAELIREKYKDQAEQLKIDLDNLGIKDETITERLHFLSLSASIGVRLVGVEGSINYEETLKLIMDCLKVQNYSIALEYAPVLLEHAPEEVKKATKELLLQSFHDETFKKICLSHDELAFLLTQERLPQEVVEPSAPPFEKDSSRESTRDEPLVQDYISIFNRVRDFEKKYATMSQQDRLETIENLERQVLTIEVFIIQEAACDTGSYIEKMEGVLSEISKKIPEAGKEFKENMSLQQKLEIAKKALHPSSLLQVLERTSEGKPEGLKGIIQEVDPISLHDFKEVEEMKASWENDGLIHPDSHKEYLDYIQKVAFYMQQYQKERRSINPNPIILKYIKDLKREWNSIKDSGIIPTDDQIFFEHLLGDNTVYQLGYFSSEEEKVSSPKYASGSLTLHKDQKAVMLGDNLHYYYTSGDGNCSINSLGFAMIGLIHQGRYDEEERFLKLLEDGDDELFKTEQKISRAGRLEKLNIEEKISSNLYKILSTVFDSLPEEKQNMLKRMGINENSLKTFKTFKQISPKPCKTPLDFYYLLKEVFSTGDSSNSKPFDLLFNLESPKRNNVIGNIQEILSLSLRKVIVKKLKEKGGVSKEIETQIQSVPDFSSGSFKTIEKIDFVLNETFDQKKDALPIISGIEEVRGDPELLFDSSVPFSVKTVVRSLHSNLLTAFRTCLETGNSGDEASLYFQQDKHLIGIVQELAKKFKREFPGEQFNINQHFNQKNSFLYKSWMKLLKKAFIDHVTVIDAHNVWMHGSELLPLTEELSSIDTHLNLYIHGASSNNYLGEIPQEEWQALSPEERSFLRGTSFIDPDGLFKEHSRGMIIRYFNSKESGNFLRKKLKESETFMGLNTQDQESQFIEQRKKLEKLMLQWHDQKYLREEYWKRKKIITIGMRFKGAHFEYGTNDQGGFDMAQPQNGLSSYDDTDTWDSIKADIGDFIVSAEKQLKKYKEILAHFYYKSLCMGGQGYFPEELLKLKEKMDALMKEQT